MEMALFFSIAGFHGKYTGMPSRAMKKREIPLYGREKERFSTWNRGIDRKSTDRRV